MPLFEMSGNIQDPSVARKRNHDEISGERSTGKEPIEDNPPKLSSGPFADTTSTPSTNVLLQPASDESSALREAGSSSAVYNSSSPKTPTKVASAPPATASQTSNPTPKRKKLTAAEKEARDKEAAEKKEQKERETLLKKQEREEKAALKAAEKARQEEEKAARQRERDEKRKKKEEEDKIKAEQREEKKKQKEEDERRLQEEKDRKARSQPKLMQFFGGASKKVATTGPTNSNSAKQKNSQVSGDVPHETEYRKLFKPFFVHETTRWNRNVTHIDKKTQALRSKKLDECITEQNAKSVTFDPVALFSLSSSRRRRGKLHYPVRHIMEGVYKEMERSGNSVTSASDELQSARKKLIGIPMKIIAFSQDVRPPYYGTVTHRQFTIGQGNMSRAARQSTSRRLQLDYDYDSEAEWQEEEGEDLDAEDDDEELDDEDDLDGFLDDSEDAGLSRRIFGNAMEPECTGICFENADGKVTKQGAADCKMEMILDEFYTTGSIDPFATSYWVSEPKLPTTTKGVITWSSSKTAAEKMPPPPTPAASSSDIKSAFSGGGGGGSSSVPVADKLVRKELMDDVKRAILQNRALSKAGLMDFIFKQFRDKASRVQVKNTLELVAEKKKTGKTTEWDLKPGHEIVS